MGKYYILEKEAPSYYQLNNEKMYFEVKENGKVIKANMQNHRKEGSLTIIKKDSLTNKLLKGAKFDIYFVETNKKIYSAVTDKNGKIYIKGLIAGKYCIKEVKAPKRYSISSKKNCFKIQNNGQNIKLIIKNNKELKVPDTSLYNYLDIIFSLIIILGLGSYIYVKNN